jgi:hypothetical protein
VRYVAGMSMRGKYDELADEARNAARAEAVIMIVLSGYLGRGTGYSFQAASTLDEEINRLMQLAASLRVAADEITAGVRRLRQDQRKGV